MTFEEKLKALRLKKGMSQQATAVALGLSLGAYQRFESGKQRPGYDNLIRIADLFEVSLDWLTGRDKPIVELAKRDKKEALRHLLSLFPKEGLDLDPDKVREERLG